VHPPFLRESKLGVPKSIPKKLGEQKHCASKELTVAKMFFNFGRQLVGKKKSKALFCLCFTCCFDFLFSFSKTACPEFESLRPCQRKIRVRKNADFSLYYSLFIIHHSLFIRPTRGFLMKNE